MPYQISGLVRLGLTVISISIGCRMEISLGKLEIPVDRAIIRGENSKFRIVPVIHRFYEISGYSKAAVSEFVKYKLEYMPQVQ